MRPWPWPRSPLALALALALNLLALALALRISGLGLDCKTVFNATATVPFIAFKASTVFGQVWQVDGSSM